MADSIKQKEYNELLKSTQSLLGSITKSMSNLSNETDKRNKKLQQDLDITKDIFSMMKKEEDVESAINLLVEQRNKILKTNYGANEKSKKSALGQVDASISLLKSHQADIEVLKGVGAQLDKNKDKANEFVDELSGKLGKIPLIGKGLQSYFKPFFDKSKKIISKTFDIFRTGFASSFGSATGTTLQRFNAGLSGGLANAKMFLDKINPGILKFAKNALIAVAAFFALKKLFDAGFASFKRIEGAAKEFRMSTGLLTSQTAGLNDKIKNTETAMASIGGSAEDAAVAAGEFTNTFDGIVQPSEAAMMNLVAMNKSLGVGFSEATQLAKVFRNLGDMTEDQAIAQTSNVAMMAKIAGVAPQKVIADMASSSEEMYKFFGGNTKAMAATAVEAAKLGSSIKEISDISAGLLDYDSSINAELEASAILGRNINFSQARAYAATGDTLGAYKEIGKQLDQIGDLTNLNYFEQQRISQATGQEFSALVNQQKIRQKFGELDGNKLKAAQQYLKAEGDLSGITNKQLKAKAEEIRIQDEINSRTDKLANKFNAVKISIQNALVPLAEAFMPIMEGIAWVASKVAGFFGLMQENAGLLTGILGGLVGVLTILGVKAAYFAVKSIVGAIGAIWTGSMKLGPFGIAAAIAGTLGLIGGIAAGVSASKKDDVALPGIGDGYGKRVISAPEGTFALNDKDTIIAGTDLGGKSKREQRAFSRAEQNLLPLLQKMDLLIAATKGKQVLVADGRKLAETTANQQEVSLKNNFGLNSAIAT